MKASSEKRMNSVKMDSVTISIQTVSVAAATQQFDMWFELTGSDEAGAIQVKRTFIEFSTLQSLLQRRWPGFIIPPVLTRRMSPEDLPRSLELFMQRLAELRAVYTASETQRFLRSPRAYADVVRDLTSDVHCIALTYESVLNDYYRQSFSQNLLTELVEYRRALQLNETQLKQVVQQVRQVTKAHQGFEKEYLRWLAMLEAFGQGQEPELPVFEPIDEYAMVADWAETELRETRAALLALTQIIRIDEHRRRLLVKQETQQVAIADLSDSRKFFSKQKTWERKQQALSQTVEEIRDYSQVLKVAVRVLHSEELPRFETRKKTRHQALLTAVSDFAENYFHSLVDIVQFKFNI